VVKVLLTQGGDGAGHAGRFTPRGGRVHAEAGDELARKKGRPGEGALEVGKGKTQRPRIQAPSDP
jgi:hypothetical protein